ncbi:MAG: SH3 domain-containing protein [Tissierellia bacterium]|nr:SH3 domain-containing protein [Tissierellia bacterium]
MGKVEDYVREIIRIADDPSHGYSQGNISRWGVDYDCSSLVITVVNDAGIPVKRNGATYTGNMYHAFIKSGFVDISNSVNFSSGYGLRRGDVLLNPNLHTEIYIGNNLICGARIDENGGIIGGRKGDQTGFEICYSRYYNRPWRFALRYYEKSNEAIKVKNEKWHARTLAVCNVRESPSTNSKIVAIYGKGEMIYYDQVWEANGYRWLSYIGYSGCRRFVAYRMSNDLSSSWMDFS